MKVVSVRFTRLCLALLTSLALLVTAHSEAMARPKFAALAVDARTGRILYDQDANGLRHPASLTKMMTLYILFQDLKARRITMKTPLRVSRRAASMAPSKLGLRPGTTIPVEKAIYALVIKSANDVASTVAENLGGSEGAFAARMTKTARSIGMTRTTFRNASGLPNPAQVTTAKDMATLGLRLMRDFPQYYPYFRATSFTFNGRVIRTHNRLVANFNGTDGIKTGYIGAAGYNLVTSTLRSNRRVVGVVLGARSASARNAYMVSMITRAMPRCQPGSTIAAVPGTSKGAVNPIKAAASAPAAEPEESANAFANQADDQPDAAELAKVAQSAADEEGEDGAPTENGPKVMEAKLVPQGQPGTRKGQPLPFAVKAAQDADAAGQQVASLPETWGVQVSPFTSKTAAQAAIVNIKSAAQPALNGAQAFTVTVKKGKEIFYRVLFSGLSERAAKASCAKVNGSGKTCTVVNPQG